MNRVSVLFGLVSLFSCGAYAEFPLHQTEIQNALGVTASDSSVVILGAPANHQMGLPLKIRFPAMNVAGLVRMMDENDSRPVIGSSENLVLIGDVAEVSVSWESLCLYVTGDSTCTTSGKRKVIVGIDSYGDGFTTGSLKNSLCKHVFEVAILGSRSVR